MAREGWGGGLADPSWSKSLGLAPSSGGAYRPCLPP